MINEINIIREEIASTKSKHNQFLQSITDDKNKIKKLDDNIIHIEEARILLLRVGKKTQQELEYRISEIVSLALCAVFDDPYEFVIDFDIKRNQTEANIRFIKNGHSFAPIGDTGCGVVDVASFAARIALWNLKNPKSDNTIVLDEPFRFLDKTQQAKAGEMVKMISDKLGIQFIIVTHEDELIESSDKVFKIIKRKEVSHVI